jgi:hypothetical protein
LDSREGPTGTPAHRALDGVSFRLAAQSVKKFPRIGSIEAPDEYGLQERRCKIA